MKITYTGQLAFSPAQQKKLDAKFTKLSKLFDRGGEKEAHVILTKERHLHRAEITVNYYDHPLVSVGSHADTLTAILESVEKLEQQILKLRSKFRDTKRTPEAKSLRIAEPVVAAAAKNQGKGKASSGAGPRAAKAKAGSGTSNGKQIFKVDHQSPRKPMTVEEAMLELENGSDYLVYRDADSDRTNVLVKRPDGHFDLIES